MSRWRGFVAQSARPCRDTFPADLTQRLGPDGTLRQVGGGGEMVGITMEDSRLGEPRIRWRRGKKTIMSELTPTVGIPESDATLLDCLVDMVEPGSRGAGSLPLR